MFSGIATFICVAWFFYSAGAYPDSFLLRDALAYGVVLGIAIQFIGENNYCQDEQLAFTGIPEQAKRH